MKKQLELSPEEIKVIFGMLTLFVVNANLEPEQKKLVPVINGILTKLAKLSEEK